MAVSKALRYQILRRDNHVCRYCGAVAPDVKLHVDHVTPVALGGTDDPSNLVAACVDCNSGKSATPTDAAMIADVEADALRWSRAMQHVAKVKARQAQEQIERRFFVKDWFNENWELWLDEYGVRYSSLPDGYLDSVLRFISNGLSGSVINEAIRKAMAAKHVPVGGKFNYMCGILWRNLTELQEAAKQVLADEEEAAIG